MAIGQGKAVSDPGFRAYLCAVADWRLKKPEKPLDQLRPGILAWQDFLDLYGKYYGAEPDNRKELIHGNCVYYSTGELPERLPILPEKIPSTIVSETVRGRRVELTSTATAEDEFTGPWLADQSGPDGGAKGTP